jgi:FMN-binding domain
MRAAGAGLLAGLGLTYPLAAHYTSSGSSTAVTVTSGGASVQGGQGAPDPTPSTTAGAGAGAGVGAGAGAGGAASTRQVLKAAGPTLQTRYGPVQVRVVVVASGGSDRIRSVTAVQLPAGGHSGEISSYAGPQLAQEAVAAQSAKIDTVSGASYTSDGYRRSLQAALVAVRAAEKKAAG